jgi:flagellar hook assembly protein FlgD
LRATPVQFFRNGALIKGATLHIYDASGNLVRSVKSGTWDLRDAKGRPVSAGTYLVRGVVVGKDGKREMVSAVAGVR